MSLCALVLAGGSLLSAMTASGLVGGRGSALTLVEHRMPLMEPQCYEAVLRKAMSGRGQIVRWCIGSVDDTTAVAEVVLYRSRHPSIAPDD